MSKWRNLLVYFRNPNALGDSSKISHLLFKMNFYRNDAIVLVFQSPFTKGVKGDLDSLYFFH
jgi:hypothetical protein